MDKRQLGPVDLDVKSQAPWKLKILILSWEFPPNMVGGLSRHVVGLSTHLAENGHEVHVLTAGKNSLPTFEMMDGINVHRVRPINENDDHFLSWIAGLNLAMAFKAEQLAEEVDFDIIHAHDWLVGAAAISLKELLGIPLLTTIHATEHGRNNGIYTEIQQFIHEKEHQLILESDQIIVCSEFMKEELKKVFTLQVERMVVIPNGIEPLTVNRQITEVMPVLKDKKYIFSIGRIVEEKGFETLIEAAAIAKENKKHDFVFVIAGKGPMQKEYQKRVSELGLEEHVTFIGYVTDEQRNALIQGCELAVIPSLYEPFGIVVLESMVLGKPTIVSNTGGMKGIIKHLQTGMLMVPGDPQSLMEQIEFLFNQPEKAVEIGNRGKQIVQSLYGWKRIAAETSRVMEDTLLSQRVNEKDRKTAPNK
ncbi:glycosyltransferase family 4 protein [Neobacillus cucumis]|uniref:glycosyltransferase family 4 protein n=1 Tax=Neobacillus cucumis TaxID=1740721 RepID=UPI00203FBC82|nr:glycosyltransferase family 4 protein [Neobacillus cucumis]MCM3725120.1 glycosyltransferase family 4 protein [Neobacillus cucumis]